NGRSPGSPRTRAHFTPSGSRGHCLGVRRAGKEILASSSRAPWFLPKGLTVPTATVASDLVLDEELDGLTRAEQTTVLLRTAAEAETPEVRAALQERAVEINMPVAAQIAQRYRSRGVASEDLEQVAYLALVKAAQRYEYA